MSYHGGEAERHETNTILQGCPNWIVDKLVRVFLTIKLITGAAKQRAGIRQKPRHCWMPLLAGLPG